MIFKYIILGIIQGFTEPLPISSSGHIKIFKELFNSNILNDMNFEIIVNFGSLLAVLFIYKSEIKNIINDFFKYIRIKDKKYKINYKYVLLIILGTIPCAIVGILTKDIIEDIFTTKVIGLMFIITSLLLYMIKDLKGSKEKKDITYLDALKIGLFQILALIPGISRSGATLVGAMKCDLKRKTALQFSFMLYIPISIASFILGITDLINTKKALIFPYLISMIFSSIVTFFSIKLFINITKKGKLIYFSIYCFILGLLTYLLS